MTFNRLPLKDPRTVARDIPGIFDIVFPQLISGVVAYFNRQIDRLEGVTPLSDDLVKASTLSRSMLFELAYSSGEQLLSGKDTIQWDDALRDAVSRQQRHFDAKIPDSIDDIDKQIAQHVASNMQVLIKHLEISEKQSVIISPEIPGFRWISSGNGDFAIADALIEVKCTNKRFSASDYRQVVMYWLLSYMSFLEGKTPEWKRCILINPRKNYILEFTFSEILQIIASGKSKLEIVEQFSSLILTDKGGF